MAATGRATVAASLVAGAGMRNKKCGLVRMRSMPPWMQPSKPFVRPARQNRISVCTSPSFTGRRYARRARLERIVVAHGSSSASAVGRQVKIFLRLALSSDALAPNGPAISTVLIADVAAALLVRVGAGREHERFVGAPPARWQRQDHQVAASGCEEARLEHRVAVERVLLELRVAQIVLRVALGRRRALHQPGLVEQLHACAVEPHVDRLRVTAKTANVFVLRPLQPELDGVLAIERERVANGDAARAEREVLARPVTLFQRAVDAVEHRRHHHRGVTNGEATHLSAERHVSLEQHRRDRQRLRNIVEATGRVLGG